MKQQVSDYLQNKSISDTKIVVAVSGGPDSIALLYILNELKPEFNLELEAAYVNHGIRSESENLIDYELIVTHCSGLDIKLNVKNIPNGYIERQSEITKNSIEAIARDERYSYFNSLCDSNSLIALGHNRDDQIETQIMRFFQGSSIEGLIGIKSERANIIRPLISISKDQIYDYLSQHNITFSIDSTNLSDLYLRNKIRNKLVPIIKEIFPGYDNSLKKIECNMKQYCSYVDVITNDLKWFNKNNNLCVDYYDFISLPVFLREKEIFKIFNKTYKGNVKDFRLPKRFLNSLNRDQYGNNKIVLSGYGFCLKRENNNLIWIQDTQDNIYFNIKITGQGTYTNSSHQFVITEDNVGINVPCMKYPFVIRGCIKGYPEMKIIKRNKLIANDTKNIIILEKNNSLCAIIYKKEIIYRTSSDIGNINMIIS